MIGYPRNVVSSFLQHAIVFWLAALQELKVQNPACRFAVLKRFVDFLYSSQIPDCFANTLFISSSCYYDIHY